MKHHILISILLTSASITPVFADTIKIDLTKKPEFTEEGIHLTTKQGNYSMYAVNANKKIFDAFRQAKNGQCLELDTEKGFDFSDASGIKSVKSCSNFQKIDLTQLERWKAEMTDQKYYADSYDRVIAETVTHFVIYQNAGTSCPAGTHWLFNKQMKSYRSVDGGTCDDRNFKAILQSNKLIFMSGNKITAQYPIY